MSASAGVFGRRIAERRQHIRHAGGVVDVHLAAIGLDEELLRQGGQSVRSARRATRLAPNMRNEYRCGPESSISRGAPVNRLRRSFRPRLACGRVGGAAGILPPIARSTPAATSRGNAGQRLARAEVGESDRRVELDHDRRPGRGRLSCHQMAAQLHVAVPGEERPEAVADRHAVRAWHRRPRPAGRSPSAFAVDAPRLGDANSALRNGSTRLPSLEVPSGNRMRLSPAFSRASRSSRCLAWCGAARSTKTVRCSFASKPKNGQLATSVLATKRAGMSEPSTVMSR